MATKLRRVTAEQFKKALAAGREHVKHLLPCKSIAAEIVREPGQSDLIQTWTISTGDVDRDNDTIDPAGWDLDPFSKGGCVLWAHNTDMPPIAKPIKTWVENGKLKSRAEFASRELSPFGFMIGQMAAQGFVRSASVGFIPKEWKETSERPGYCPLDFVRAELLEWSVVPVPSNREALLDAKSKGIDLAPLAEFASQQLDSKTAEGLYCSRESLEEMYRAAKGDAPVVSVPATAVADPDPAATVETKEAPVADPTIHDAPPSAPPPTVSGHTPEPVGAGAVAEIIKQLEDKTNDAVCAVLKAATDAVAIVKAGRVLSSSNEDKLRQARDLLSAVIVQVDEQPEEEASPVVEPKSFRLVVSEPQQVEAAPVVGVSQEKLSQLLKDTLLETVNGAIRRAMGRLD
jgi:hypothetical protein